MTIEVGWDTHVARTAVLVACLSLAVLSSCQTEALPEEDALGLALLSVREVPQDIHCIRISVVTQTRSIQRDFDVMPGTSAALQLDALPVGAATFSGDAYQLACAELTSMLSASPSWSSGLVVGEIARDMVTTIKLVMKKNRTVNVEVAFDDASACSGPDAQPCGLCGTQQRVCTDSTWSPWGPCTAEGECEPGELESCSQTGTRRCGQDCHWLPGCSCTGPAPVVKCGLCGTRPAKCETTGEWILGPCLDFGQCQPGSVQACGSTGTGKQVCSPACHWSTCM